MAPGRNATFLEWGSEDWQRTRLNWLTKGKKISMLGSTEIRAGTRPMGRDGAGLADVLVTGRLRLCSTLRNPKSGYRLYGRDERRRVVSRTSTSWMRCAKCDPSDPKEAG